MSTPAIVPCKCGQEPPYVWLYSQHDPLAGTVVWHVFCKSCRAEVVRSTKRQALSAWAHEYVVHLGMNLCAICQRRTCAHSDLEFAGIVPACAPHGAGYLASDLASPSPRAGSDAPSDHSFAHAAQVDRT